MVWRKAFTLIELLVVIGIIMLLLALVTPARERQRRGEGPGASAVRSSLRHSSRWTFSRRSCRSWASSESVAMGRASSRLRLIGSPVSSQ